MKDELTIGGEAHRSFTGLRRQLSQFAAFHRNTDDLRFEPVLVPHLKDGVLSIGREESLANPLQIATGIELPPAAVRHRVEPEFTARAFQLSENKQKSIVRRKCQ